MPWVCVRVHSSAVASNHKSCHTRGRVGVRGRHMVDDRACVIPVTRRPSDLSRSTATEYRCDDCDQCIAADPRHLVRSSAGRHRERTAGIGRCSCSDFLCDVVHGRPQAMPRAVHKLGIAIKPHGSRSPPRSSRRCDQSRDRSARQAHRCPGRRNATLRSPGDRVQV